MPGRNRSKDTIAAMLSSAPALTSAPGGDRPKLEPIETVRDATAELVRPDNLTSAPEPEMRTLTSPVVANEAEYDDEDLEAFELQADRPLVRPRRREAKDYQTVRINRPTARILRAQWLKARSIDPLMSYTEFSTLTVQAGLRALKEQRERGA